MIRNIDVWLQDEFKKRKSKNPSYSLRAFAKFLEVSPAMLSRVFSGNLQMSAQIAERIMTQLGYSAKEIQEIMNSYLELDRKDDVIKEKLKRLITDDDLKPIDTYFLSVEEFLKISQWKYTFLYKLMDIVPADLGKDQYEKWLSDKSGFSLPEIQEILEAFLELDLISIYDDSFTKHYNAFSFRGREGEAMNKELIESFCSTVSELAHKGSHSLKTIMLNDKPMTKASIEADGINLLNWDLYPVDKDTAFAAEKMIESFYRDMEKLFRSSEGKKTEIYCMCSQFFKLTNKVERFL